GFAGINGHSPVICLNHNPANCVELLNYPWQWMLSGHTHGRQIATSAIGQKLYGHRHREYTHGHYAVKGRHLYVNRGLSYGQRVTFFAKADSSSADIERLLGPSASRAVVAIEAGWYARARGCKLYIYTLARAGFELLDEEAGYWVNRDSVKPSKIIKVSDCL